MNKLTFEQCDKCKHSHHDANGNILCNNWELGTKVPDFFVYDEEEVYCLLYSKKENIVKTTEYFRKSIEELSQKRECGTVEEALILDSGLETYWFSTLNGVTTRLNEPKWKQYVKSHDYEVIVFEMVVENDNNNKYCIVCR